MIKFCIYLLVEIILAKTSPPIKIDRPITLHGYIERHFAPQGVPLVGVALVLFHIWGSPWYVVNYDFLPKFPYYIRGWRFSLLDQKSFCFLWNTSYRLYRQQGAQFRALFCLPCFLFWFALFFLIWCGGRFFQELYFRPPFFYFTRFFASKASFLGIFPVFLLAPSFRPPFFILKALSFFFYMEGAVFLRSFALPFFCALSI